MRIDEEPGLWARQWEREGILKGQVAGQAQLLERQLAHRFGPLPAAVVQRLRQGTLEQTEAWGLNFVDATSLEEVFGKT